MTRYADKVFDMINRHYTIPDVVLMSSQSAREILHQEPYNLIDMLHDKTRPDTIFGVRIAYDDSLAEGEFIVAWTTYTERPPYVSPY